jgi:hypothetical protein
MSSFSRRAVAVAVIPAVVLAGCYVVPVAPDGRPLAVYPVPSYGAAPAPAPAPTTVVTTARLYPSNDVAAQAGVLTGTVTNHMNGRGEFQLSYQGEAMSGEATRVNNDQRRGVANAYGPRGTYMNCQYQMNSTTQGTGTCTMSNGGRYQLHIGS